MARCPCLTAQMAQRVRESLLLRRREGRERNACLQHTLGNAGNALNGRPPQVLQQRDVLARRVEVQEELVVGRLELHLRERR